MGEIAEEGDKLETEQRTDATRGVETADGSSEKKENGDDNLNKEVLLTFQYNLPFFTWIAKTIYTIYVSGRPFNSQTFWQAYY